MSATVELSPTSTVRSVPTVTCFRKGHQSSRSNRLIWDPTACKRELHLVGDFAKPLNDELDRRLHDGPTHNLVLMAEVADPKLASRRSAIRQEVAKYGYRSTQCRVYTANQVAGSTNRHTALAASLRQWLSTCESYETWRVSRDVRHPVGFVADSRRLDKVDQITT